MKRGGLLSLGAFAAGLAGLEGYNRLVTIPRTELEPQLPARPTMWRWRYGDVAVYEAGDPANPPLLLLHGHNAAASAAEMREPFERLSARFHVYAPDLIGYGLSARPDIDYSPALYVELIEEILREVVQRPANVLASSLTASHAIEAAYANRDWIECLVLVCPSGVRSLTEQSAGGRAVEMVLRLPLLGQALFNGIASRRGIRYFLDKEVYYDPFLVTDEVVERYYRTAHLPGARYAPAAFVSGKLYWDASEAWTRLEQRVLLVWGKEARITPASDAAAFLATNPAADLEEISGASILPHEEQPEQFANIVSAWLER